MMVAAAGWTAAAAAPPQNISAQVRGAQAGVERLVTPVHGFHCRPEYGWNSHAGVYNMHRHEGVCESFDRCIGVHRKCLRVFARGWDKWNYERWGFNNWKYTSCMIRYGCN
jgi:hypothetical protein